MVYAAMTNVRTHQRNGCASSILDGGSADSRQCLHAEFEMRSKGHGADCGKTLYRRLVPLRYAPEKSNGGSLDGRQVGGPSTLLALPTPKACVPTRGIDVGAAGHTKNVRWRNR